MVSSAAGPAPVRCAIYTRVATSAGLEEERRALAAQWIQCAAFVGERAARGWQLVPMRFDDGGCSGTEIGRPALQRLLAAIDAGAVDVVVATRIDRLCTSMFDAVHLVDWFKRSGAVFHACEPIVIRCRAMHALPEEFA